MSKARLVNELRSGSQGRLIGPEDADHDEARRIWNDRIDKRPSLIAQCAGTSDVVAAVYLAGENRDAEHNF